MIETKEPRCPRCNTLLHGRHCLTDGCGYTRPQSQEELVREGKLKPHNKVEPTDGQSLVETMKAFGLTLPTNAVAWRTTGAGPGKLPQFELTVTLLCTDGIVAWFSLADGTPFFGHLAAFVPNKAEGYKGPRKAKKKSRRQELLDSI